VIDIDEGGPPHRHEAGAQGPDLEAQLEKRGWTIGWLLPVAEVIAPTVGGWVATRSSGMKSDK
jgi:alkyldihydroxyacetonephosphate synthase